MSTTAVHQQQPIDIGISNLPNQCYKIVSKRGGQFNLMVCGESGLGKTTFVNTLFQTTLKPVSLPANTTETSRMQHRGSIKKTTEINITRCILEEKNFELKVNVIDTPGFGDNVNNNKCWNTIIDFIDDQHDSFMRQEQQPFRKTKFDLRVHAVLYFIKPTGHGLKPLDVATMKSISTRANLIPVISKSDTLTKEELNVFKLRIRQVIEAQNIRIFTPPLYNSNTSDDLGSTSSNNDDIEDSQAAMEHSKQLIEAMPFAVIGSETRYDLGNGNTAVLGRQYPWGVVEVENDDHCDFRKLRSLLLRTNLLDLILTTEEVHYETYRKLRLENADVNSSSTSSDKDIVDGSIPPPIPARKLSHNPKFKEEEIALKKYFTDQVKAEEQRFRQWEQNIVNERIRLNNDLEEVQNKVKKLEEQIKTMQMKKI
ncbi:probable Cell division control protein 12 [Saccharomycodes ludwigii]|uniref:Probable Cell division control protein 12 n=1 Tax=Saccharomycodes ludwigii TaxID=36035 RepID=A0A376B7A8_9ASCO|nr:hypothetical protein SCDLUD_003192 [Saccharomycodes ludwigii]KAH3900221.1 hypothetical protein SCDLUD_003192 [Saccharomycodes ludwigii]SSD60553.1 probable Cell division control protein 12 [Saccharomycodes ludwigii]